MMNKIPAYLVKGNCIGITCPAGYMAKEKAQVCISSLQRWGYEVMIGKTLGSGSENYFSGTDEERLVELQAMLDSKDVHAILCGRGGYGVSRIIDRLDFSAFKKHPKWIIGYSDITVLHSHLHTKLKIASLHSPMAAAFNDGLAKNDYLLALQKILKGKKINYRVPAHPFNKKGEATGELVGGNLALLANLIGTPSDCSTKNKILFIEDTGEFIYSTDRMLWQLKRAGKLSQLAGLIVGGFSDVKDTDRPFGMSVYEAILEATREYNYPVVFGFPVGHAKENYPLKHGVRHTLQVGARSCSLAEI